MIGGAAGGGAIGRGGIGGRGVGGDEGGIDGADPAGGVDGSNGRLGGGFAIEDIKRKKESTVCSPGGCTYQLLKDYTPFLPLRHLDNRRHPYPPSTDLCDTYSPHLHLTIHRHPCLD